MIQTPVQTIVRFTELRAAIYRKHSAGGGLHIVLDDFNTRDIDLDFCASESLEPEEIEMIALLRPLSVEQRWWLVGNFSNAAPLSDTFQFYGLEAP